MSLNLVANIPWYLPTLYGDIRLTAQGKKTEIEWDQLSPSERQALTAIGAKFKVDTSESLGKILVDRPIEKVESILVKAMKNGRKLLSAVVFKNGKVEEVHRSEEGARPYQTPAPPPDSPPKAAVTVAQPTMSCPVPEFERAEVRANRVLRAFLTPAQLEDFERTQQFLVEGVDSGHRYILTSRQAPKAVLDRVGGRSVFDVTRGHAVCVHDWTVPASEELLGLSLFLQMQGRERYVSVLAFEPLVGSFH